MSYYKTNALYQELEKREDPAFVWVSGNAWILLYADSSAIVRVLAFVSGSSVLQAVGSSRSRLEIARGIAETLAVEANVPFTDVEFDDSVQSISSVRQDGETKSLDELREWFEAAGLPVTGKVTTKAINDASSSAYHNWQRANLGAIKVTDLDLIRLDSATGKVVEIYELKRSFQSFTVWRPYPVDFPNFNVVANLAERVGSWFSIVYNIRETKPVIRDDASNVSLFEYSSSKGASALGVFSFEDFVVGSGR